MIDPHRYASSVAARSGTPYVIAVDAGGSHTRVGRFALDGSMLSRAVGLRGAALLAYEVAGVRTDPDVTDRLVRNGSAELVPPPS